MRTVRLQEPLDPVVRCETPAGTTGQVDFAGGSCCRGLALRVGGGAELLPAAVASFYRTQTMAVLAVELVLNTEFLRFAAHWGFRARWCRPYRARTKSKVERPIRYIRESFFYGQCRLGEDANLADVFEDAFLGERHDGRRRFRRGSCIPSLAAVTSRASSAV